MHPASSDPKTPPHFHTHDTTLYKQRNVVERMFCRLKDFRRIATRYDKRARWTSYWNATTG